MTKCPSCWELLRYIDINSVMCLKCGNYLPQETLEAYEREQEQAAQKASEEKQQGAEENKEGGE